MFYECAFSFCCWFFVYLCECWFMASLLLYLLKVNIDKPWEKKINHFPSLLEWCISEWSWKKKLFKIWALSSFVWLLLIIIILISTSDGDLSPFPSLDRIVSVYRCPSTLVSDPLDTNWSFWKVKWIDKLYSGIKQYWIVKIKKFVLWWYLKNPRSALDSWCSLDTPRMNISFCWQLLGVVSPRSSAV